VSALGHEAALAQMTRVARLIERAGLPRHVAIERACDCVQLTGAAETREELVGGVVDALMVATRRGGVLPEGDALSVLVLGIVAELATSRAVAA
jgi:hypothetical protein